MAGKKYSIGGGMHVGKGGMRWAGWYLKPGILLEMGVSDAAAGASELGTRRKICKIAKANVRVTFEA